MSLGVSESRCHAEAPTQPGQRRLDLLASVRALDDAPEGSAEAGSTATPGKRGRTLAQPALTSLLALPLERQHKALSCKDMDRLGQARSPTAGHVSLHDICLKEAKRSTIQ